METDDPKPAKKKRKWTKKKSKAETKYKRIPITDADRRLIFELARRGHSLPDMVQSIINPHTGKPISQKAFLEHFEDELKRAKEKPVRRAKGGRTKLKGQTVPVDPNAGGGISYEPTDIDRHQVTRLVGFGIDHRKIAQLIINPKTGNPISRETLSKHFAYELQLGKELVVEQVGNSLLQKALSNHPGAVTAAIYLSKVIGGWKEKQEVEITTRQQVMVVPAEVTPQQWIEAEMVENQERTDPTAKLIE